MICINIVTVESSKKNEYFIHGQDVNNITLYDTGGKRNPKTTETSANVAVGVTALSWFSLRISIICTSA